MVYGPGCMVCGWCLGGWDYGGMIQGVCCMVCLSTMVYGHMYI